MGNRSLVLVKPDAIGRKLLGYCIAAYEAQGKILEIKLFDPPALWLIERHYHEHQGKDFYPGLIQFMQGPLAAVAVGVEWQVARNTALRLRSHFRDLVNGPANLVHASDSQKAAEFELSLWFPGLRS